MIVSALGILVGAVECPSLLLFLVCAQGLYSRNLRGLAPDQKYSVRVMGITLLSQSTGLLTDVVTYDPASE